MKGEYGVKRTITMFFILFLILLLLMGWKILQFFWNREEPFKVALLLEGNRYDQGWDSQGYEGLILIERIYHAKVKYVEFNNRAADQEIISQGEALIKEGFSMIFGHGRVFENGFNLLGRKYPHVKLILINGESFVPNVYSVRFSGWSMGYFAGLMAGIMTETGKVGIVAAYEDIPEVTGFSAGVKKSNPKAKVFVGKVGSWGDRVRGKKEADMILNQGADILFPAGDAFAIEVINAAREHHAYAIGFITDQSFIARDAVLVSIIQNVKRIYVELAGSYLRGDLDRYRGMEYDFNNGGHDLTPFSTKVPPAVQSQMRRYLEEYKKNKGIDPQ